jgi:hypothetical protein
MTDIAGLCERLRAALECVTPGPWDDTMGRSGLRIIEGDSGCPVASYVSEKDAAFIALSREAVPSFLDALERQAAEIEMLRGALERIERWFGEFPETGRFWPSEDPTESARPMSYGAAWGSNGERDFMRAVARAALTGEDA